MDEGGGIGVATRMRKQERKDKRRVSSTSRAQAKPCCGCSVQTSRSVTVASKDLSLWPPPVVVLVAASWWGEARLAKKLVTAAAYSREALNPSNRWTVEAKRRSRQSIAKVIKLGATR